MNRKIMPRATSGTPHYIPSRALSLKIPTPNHESSRDEPGNRRDGKIQMHQLTAKSKVSGEERLVNGGSMSKNSQLRAVARKWPERTDIKVTRIIVINLK